VRQHRDECVIPVQTTGQKTALITGVTGQDGYYMSRQLVDSGVQVHGIVGPDDGRESAVIGEVSTHKVNLTDADAVLALVRRIAPDYVFHLAGVSSVAMSWSRPVYTTEVNALSTTAVLDACMRVQDDSGHHIAVVNASSAEVFAGDADSPQNEDSLISPTSPYGVSKALGHMMCHIYRSKGLAASNAILFNHESPRRPTTFVTRKITSAVAAIAGGAQESVTLGNLSLQRDWGWAPDYVDAMIRMARFGSGDDFVVATGTAHSIADFVAAAFAAVGIEDWQSYVKTDRELTRPADSAVMVGNPTRAEEVLGWRRTLSFEEIVAAMVNADRKMQEAHDGL